MVFFDCREVNLRIVSGVFTGGIIIFRFPSIKKEGSHRLYYALTDIPEHH